MRIVTDEKELKEIEELMKRLEEKNKRLYEGALKIKEDLDSPLTKDIIKDLTYNEQKLQFHLRYNYIDLYNSDKIICTDDVDDPIYKFNFTIGKEYKILKIYNRYFDYLGNKTFIVIQNDKGEKEDFSLESGFGDCFCTPKSFKKKNIVTEQSREQESLYWEYELWKD